jgi:hypothetical protein
MLLQLKPQLNIFIMPSINSPTISHKEQTLAPNTQEKFQHTTSYSYFGTTWQTGHEILHTCTVDDCWNNLQANIKNQD